MSRQVLLVFVVVLAFVMVDGLVLAPILMRMLGVHGGWVAAALTGALTGASAVVGVLAANKILRIRGRR